MDFNAVNNEHDRQAPSPRHIVVIGAGVTGVTSAFALARRGFKVSVLDRLAGPALETSYANAGQRSYGYVSPWASPAMLKHALPWLLSADGPLKIALPPSAASIRFLIQTLGYIFTPGLYPRNKRAMLRLAAYSRDCFLALEQELDLVFDGDHHGLIDLASDARALQDLQATAKLLSELGIANQLLSPAQVREWEPGLRGTAPLQGGLRCSTDGTGDCHRFTQALAEQCQQLGVQFHYQQEVRDVEWTGSRITALGLAATSGGTEHARQRLEADQFVLCAGCDSARLGRLLGEPLPIYPVTGYSLTAAIADPQRAPRSTVIDDRYKVVATRLGQRLRVTGFVELADGRREIPAQRLATLRRALASRFPGAADLNQAEPWCGFRPMTPDGPPIIGPAKCPNLFLNTGHGTFGWTLSAASAELTAQTLSGERPAMPLDAFRPGRFNRRWP